MNPVTERIFDPRRQRDITVIGMGWDFLVTVAMEQANAGRVNGYPNVETWDRKGFDKTFHVAIDSDEDS